MIMNTVETCSNAALKTLTEKCKTLTQFKQIHAQLIKCHLPDNPIAIGPLLSAAATSKDPSFFSYARSIFQNLRFRNTFMYNTMIRGYVQNDNQVFAVISYIDMLRFGLAANNYTFPPLIKACCLCSSIVNLKLVGCSIHGHVLQLGFEGDQFVGTSLIEFYSANFEIGSAQKVFDEMPVKDVVLWTSLIDGYGKNKDVENAQLLFDEMPERSVISWSVIMAAYSRISDFEKVVSLFKKMQELGIKPNESVLVTVLTACAHLGALAQGLWVHSYAKSCNLISNPILATALVDMYSKCGCPDLALSVFNSIYVKDTGAWNAIISGLAMNGKAKSSLELLNEMASLNIQPSAATFVAILTACTHTKLVKEGLELFEKMDRLYGVKPQIEHYACVVDLFARAGLLKEAMEFVEKKLGDVGELDANVWGALLGACRTYGNVKVGNRVWLKLVDMKVNDYGICVVSYNMYKEAGWKREAEEVRNMIAEFGRKKTPGCSVVEVNGVVKEFVSGDINHPQGLEIHKMLDSLFNVARLV
ncbi:pentatricopeptide repeat-containing protein At5g06540-like [Rutidosis leptorrhynchoides]|uniref:pentatricopeptide repeat-containing protein At5g06540-like n=1 Tax=Rutidosis leptorrhynchoides TaxID=125765 RepID=UPI003A9A6188